MSRPTPPPADRSPAPAALVAAAILLFASGTGPLLAQERPAWETSLRYAVELHDGGDRDAWHTTTIGLERGGEIATIRLEGRATRRFATTDADARLTAWTELWSDAWTRLSAAGAVEGVVLPRADLAADVYQSIGRWEAGVGLRWLDVGEDVTVVRLAAARYAGDLYLRLDGFRTDGGEKSGTAVVGRVRGFLDGPGEHWEVAVARGTTLELAADDRFVVLGSTRVTAGLERSIDAGWGIGLSASATDLEDVPTRYGLGVTLRRKW